MALSAAAGKANAIGGGVFIYSCLFIFVYGGYPELWGGCPFTPEGGVCLSP